MSNEPMQRTFSSGFQETLGKVANEASGAMSDDERLRRAYRLGQAKEDAPKKQGFTKFKNELSVWHYRLGADYCGTDADWLYFQLRDAGVDIYLIVEDKYVKEKPFSAEAAVRVTPSAAQRQVLEKLGEQCQVPVYIRWWTKKPDADSFEAKEDKLLEKWYVRELGSKRSPRELDSQVELMDWLDEFRIDGDSA